MPEKTKAEASPGKEILNDVKREAKAIAVTAKKAATLAASKASTLASAANQKAMAGQSWLTQKLAEELRYAADWLSKEDTRVGPEDLLQKAAKKMLKKLRKKHNDGKPFSPK
jgi:fructoselysine-6-P-deglycase FrlB-like protein